MYKDEFLKESGMMRLKVQQKENELVVLEGFENKNNYKSSKQNSGDKQIGNKNQRGEQVLEENEKVCVSPMEVNNGLFYIGTNDLISDKNNKENLIVKYLADSGATEHLSNSKMIFKNLDDKSRYNQKREQR